MPPKHCTVCGQVREYFMCPRCNSATYCSQVCKEKDVKVHSVLCNVFAFRMASTPRPSTTCTLAFWFPAEGPVPRTIWFENGKSIERQIFTDRVNTYEIFFDKCPDLSVQVDVSHGSNTSGFLQINTKDGTGVYEHPLNESLLWATQGRQRELWHGSFVLCAISSPTQGIRKDVTMADFITFVFHTQHATGFDKVGGAIRLGHLREQEVYSPSLFTTMLQHRSRESIKGVQIIWFENTEKVVAVDVPDAHPIFYGDRTKPTSLSTHMGIPILVRGISDPHKPEHWWLGRYHRDDLSAQALHLHADPSEDRFGRFGFIDNWGGWLGGAVLVVREDKKPLTPHQVEGLVYFSYVVLIPAINGYRQRSGGEEDRFATVRAKKRREIVQDWLCRGRFEQVFLEFKRRKIEEGDVTWESEVSLYEVSLRERWSRRNWHAAMASARIWTS